MCVVSLPLCFGCLKRGYGGRGVGYDMGGKELGILDFGDLSMIGKWM